jgi:hypothetical protein
MTRYRALERIALDGILFDMNNFGVVLKHEAGGVWCNTHTFASYDESKAVHKWAEEHGVFKTGRKSKGDDVWNLTAAHKHCSGVDPTIVPQGIIAFATLDLTRDGLDKASLHARE